MEETLRTTTILWCTAGGSLINGEAKVGSLVGSEASAGGGEGGVRAALIWLYVSLSSSPSHQKAAAFQGWM